MCDQLPYFDLDPLEFTPEDPVEFIRKLKSNIETLKAIKADFDAGKFTFRDKMMDIATRFVAMAEKHQGTQ